MSESVKDEDESSSTPEPTRRDGNVRRAVLGSAVGVALLVGPIALSRAIGADGSNDVETGGEDDSPLTVAHVTAAEADRESRFRLNEALAAQPVEVEEKAPAPTTTTTTAPPTTTTTAPPTTTTTAPPPPPETTAPPAQEVAPTQSGSGTLGDPYYMPTWDHLAQCESGGNWAINTGNGYYGGIQFSLSSWQAVGGSGYPHEHSRETQIAMGQRLWEAQGWGAWPACTASFGWR